ncbi:hypothetical protein ACP4OV_021042 [Aristida adscensionis]
MGRGKRSVFAWLFGCKKREVEESAAAGRPQPRARVRPSDDDEYYGRHWYADRNIDRRASEYIERVHRGMLDGEQDG